MAGVLSSIGELAFTISPDMSGFGKALATGIEGAAGSAAGTAGVLFENLGKAMMKKFTLPLAVGAAANIAQFQALDREIRSTITLLGTAPGIVDEAFGEFSAIIGRVSTDVGGLERDIADGLYQAISAGVPRGNIEEFMGVAQMAAIADKTATVTIAVDALSTVLNAFGLEVSETASISDALFAAVAKGKTTYGELGQSIGRAAGQVANTGAEYTEFLAIISQITTAGIQTSEAVSFLRGAVTGLLRPGEEITAVFEKAGFASAEAAIPIIGLQGAFQLVVDAAGGSTSKLQELIGVAEGVSAILAITGENSEKFASTLRFVEQSAGLADNAFEIAEGGIGRSFGRMTESFDRLGNRFGEIGARIAQPVIEAVTDIVNRIIGAFKKMEPFIDTVIDLFRGLFKVFDVPGVKALAAGLASMVLVLGAFLGVLAPIIFLMGSLLKTFALLKAAIVVFSAWQGASKILAVQVNALSVAWQGVLRQMQGVLPRAVKTSAVAIDNMTAKVKVLKLALSPAGLAGIFLIVAAAVAVGVVAYQKYKSWLETIRREALITAEGVDRLADSLNITLQPIGDLISDATEGGGPAELEVLFTLKNQDLLRNLEDVLVTMGDAAARDYIIGIALQFKERGATNEEIEHLIEQLQLALGTQFEINVRLITEGDAFDFLGSQIEFIGTKWADEIGDMRAGTDNIISPKLKVQLQDTADQLANILDTQGTEKFLSALEDVEDQFGDIPVVANYVHDEVLKSIEDLAGRDLGFSVGTIFGQDQDFGDLRRQLSDTIVGFETMGETAEEVIPTIREIGVAFGDFGDLGGLADLAMTPEELAQVDSLGDGLEDSFQRAKTAITEAFDAIRQGALASMPFLDVYTRLDQKYGEWKKGQGQYVEDLGKINDLRNDIAANNEDLLPAFDQAPITKQAWLARLGPKQLEEALGILQTSFDATIDTVESRIMTDMESIMAPIQTQLNTDLQALIVSSEEAGFDVGERFGYIFDIEASKWPGIAQTHIDDTIRAIAGGEFGGTISGPTITVDVNVNNTNVNVSGGPSPNPGQDVRRALQAVEN